MSLFIILLALLPSTALAEWKVDNNGNVSTRTTIGCISGPDCERLLDDDYTKMKACLAQMEQAAKAMDKWRPIKYWLLPRVPGSYDAEQLARDEQQWDAAKACWREP